MEVFTFERRCRSLSDKTFEKVFPDKRAVHAKRPTLFPRPKSTPSRSKTLIFAHTRGLRARHQKSGGAYFAKRIMSEFAPTVRVALINSRQVSELVLLIA